MNGTKILGISTKHYGMDFSKYKTQELVNHVVGEITTRMPDNNQMLRWVNYPQEIRAEIPKLYDRFEQFANKKKVFFIGLGGSKNPLAAATDLMGKDLHDVKKTYIALLKPSDFNDSIQQMGNIENAAVVISSKSGKTPEIIAMAKAYRDNFISHYISKGNTTEEATALANKQIMVVSDKSPEKSILRKFAQEQGLFDAKEALFNVPDGMGGRFSASCSYVFAALKAAGATLEECLKFNNGMITAGKKALSTSVEDNVPFQNALFWEDSSIKHSKKLKALFHQVLQGQLEMEKFTQMSLGKSEVNLYVGNDWTRGSVFDKQLHKESIKVIPSEFEVIPDASHYAAESWYNLKNNNAFSLVSSSDIDGGLKYASGHYVTDSIVPDAQRFGSLVHTHIHDITKEGHLEPEVTGAYMTNKMFETYDRGIISDVLKKKPHLAGAMDTVTQESVEAVKVSNQKIISDYAERIKNPKGLLD